MIGVYAVYRLKGSPAHAGIRIASNQMLLNFGRTRSLLADPAMNREIGGHRRQENPPQRIGRSDLRVRRACVRPLLIPHLVRQRVIT